MNTITPWTEKTLHPLSRRRTIACIAGTGAQAENILDQLRCFDFSETDISCIALETDENIDWIRRSGCPAGLRHRAPLFGVGTFHILGRAGSVVKSLPENSPPGLIIALMADLSLPVDDAERFEEKLRLGGIFIGFGSDDSMARKLVWIILQRAGVNEVVCGTSIWDPAPFRIEGVDDFLEAPPVPINRICV